MIKTIDSSASLTTLPTVSTTVTVIENILYNIHGEDILHHDDDKEDDSENDDMDQHHEITQPYSPIVSTNDDDSTTAGDSLNNSMSLTDLHNPSPIQLESSAAQLIADDLLNNEEKSSLTNNIPLLTPPNHFQCPIFQTLFSDPVIDLEGNTYERTAILKWLVLSPSTSPITGNAMSVEELVEDSLVKKAIERWKKECWVRFLLGNASHDDGCDDGGIDGSGRSGHTAKQSGRSSSTHKATVADASGKSRGDLGKVKDKIQSSTDKIMNKKRSVSAYSKNRSGSHGSTKSHASNRSHISNRSQKSSSNGGSSNHIERKDGSISGKHAHKEHKKKKKSSSHTKKIANGEKGEVDLWTGVSSSNSSAIVIVPQDTSILPISEMTLYKKPPYSKKSVSEVLVGESSNRSAVLLSPRVISKQNPPPPPPKESKPHRIESTKGSQRVSNPHRSSGRSHHNHARSTNSKNRLSSSQKTAVTANITPTTASDSAVDVNAVLSLLPPPPFVSPSPSFQSKPPCVISQNSPVPIENIIRQESSSGSSFCSNLSTNPSVLLHLGTETQGQTPMPRYNGWSVPLGVHKVLCSEPGLKVSTQLHRRSVPVKVNVTTEKNGIIKKEDLILPPGSHVEILETRVHGDRVRGRICWEEEQTVRIGGDDIPTASDKKGKSLKKRTSRLLKRTTRRNKKSKNKSQEVVVINKYEGWISLQWVNKEELNDADEESVYANTTNDTKEEVGNTFGMERVTDEDLGPWTVPVPLGVYRIKFRGHLPLRETPERDSAVLRKLDRGQCVEVVQTQVKGDRVRARIMFMEDNEEDNTDEKKVKKSTSGWISLLNALTGSSGASPVPLGAYVVVAEPGCTITEGGRLDSKIKGKLVPGSCMEVVATRMEEGVVRGLLEGGGHVTLFSPPRANGNVSAATNNANASSSNLTRKNADGGKMNAMPVPLGTYQIVQSNLYVTTAISSTSSIVMKLQMNARAEVIETRVEDGRVRGRICGVVNEDGTRVVGYEKGMMSGTSSSSGNGVSSTSESASGWINLFEPNQRWAKIVRFKGGKPVG